jgi:hypothetical protein
VKPELERHAEKMRSGRNKTFSVPASVENMITKAAGDWGVQVRHVRDTSEHDPRAVMARRQAVKAIHALGFSTTMTGRFLGGMHHTSVMYALKQATPKRLPEKFKQKPVRNTTLNHFPDLSGEWAI